MYNILLVIASIETLTVLLTYGREMCKLVASKLVEVQRFAGYAVANSVARQTMGSSLSSNRSVSSVLILV